MPEVSLSEASKILKCSTKTIRRKIHAGAILARLVSGHKGPEYRILLDDNSVVSSKSKMKSSKSNRNVKNYNLPETRETSSSNLDPNSTGYKKLYDDLSHKYEQSLILIGRLQAELDKKLPQLESEASSLKEKYDLLKLAHDEKHRKVEEHKEALATKEYVIAELAKEIDKAHIELKRRESPFYGIKKLFGLA